MTKPTPVAAFIREAAALIANDHQRIAQIRRRVVVDGVVVLVTVQKGKS